MPIGKRPAVCCASSCSIRSASEVSFVILGDARTARDGDDCRCRWCAMPSAERETGGVAVDVVGAGEIARAPDARTRAGRSVGARRRGGRPRVAVDDRVPPCGRWRAPRRARSRVVVVRYTPQAVLDRQRRGSALSHARVGRRPAARRGALRRPQQPAQLPEGRRCRRDRRSGARRSAGGRSVPASPRPSRAAAARKGPRRRTRRRRRSSSTWSTCSGSTRGSTRAARASSCRRSICPISRTGVELHYSPRFRVEPQPDRSGSRHDPGPFAEALRLPCAPPPAAPSPTPDAPNAARSADCRRWSTRSGTNPAAASSSVRCRFT